MTLIDYAVYLGAPAVIVVPGREDIAVILAQLSQDIRTRADRVAVELFLPNFFEVSRRYQLAAVVADIILEVGVRGVGVDIDRQVIHDHDFLDECPLLIKRDIADGGDGRGRYST